MKPKQDDNIGTTPAETKCRWPTSQTRAVCYVNWPWLVYLQLTSPVATALAVKTVQNLETVKQFVEILV